MSKQLTLKRSILELFRLRGQGRWTSVDSVVDFLAKVGDSTSTQDVEAVVHELMEEKRLELQHDKKKGEQFRLIWTDEDSLRNAQLVTKCLESSPEILKAIRDALSDSSPTDISVVTSRIAPLRTGGLLEQVKVSDLLSAVPGVICIRNEEINYLAYKLPPPSAPPQASTATAAATAAAASGRSSERKTGARELSPARKGAFIEDLAEYNKAAAAAAADPKLREAVITALSKLGPDEWMSQKDLGHKIRHLKSVYEGVRLLAVLGRMDIASVQKDEVTFRDHLYQLRPQIRKQVAAAAPTSAPLFTRAAPSLSSWPATASTTGGAVDDAVGQDSGIDTYAPPPASSKAREAAADPAVRAAVIELFESLHGGSITQSQLGQQLSDCMSGYPKTMKVSEVVPLVIGDLRIIKGGSGNNLYSLPPSAVRDGSSGRLPVVRASPSAARTELPATTTSNTSSMPATASTAAADGGNDAYAPPPASTKAREAAADPVVRTAVVELFDSLRGGSISQSKLGERLRPFLRRYETATISEVVPLVIKDLRIVKGDSGNNLYSLPIAAGCGGGSSAPSSASSMTVTTGATASRGGGSGAADDGTDYTPPPASAMAKEAAADPAVRAAVISLFQSLRGGSISQSKLGERLRPFLRRYNTVTISEVVPLVIKDLRIVKGDSGNNLYSLPAACDGGASGTTAAVSTPASDTLSSVPSDMEPAAVAASSGRWHNSPDDVASAVTEAQRPAFAHPQPGPSPALPVSTFLFPPFVPRLTSQHQQQQQQQVEGHGTSVSDSQTGAAVTMAALPSFASVAPQSSSLSAGYTSIVSASSGLGLYAYGSAAPPVSTVPPPYLVATPSPAATSVVSSAHANGAFPSFPPPPSAGHHGTLAALPSSPRDGAMTSASAPAAAFPPGFLPPPAVVQQVRELLAVSEDMDTEWIGVSAFDKRLARHGVRHLAGPEPLVVVLARIPFLEGREAEGGKFQFRARKA